jgi:DNA-binding MarR family transcriptional regulator
MYSGEMASSRLPRFKRAAAVPPIQLTGRDHEILRLVNRHRFLRSSDIITLLATSPQQILRRLQLLYHHGYVERPRCQLDYYYRGGSRQIVYGLGDKGAAALKQAGSASSGARWSEKNRIVGRVQLEHWLMVSEVMVAIEMACRSSGCRLITNEHLISSDERQPFRWKVNTSEGMKLGVIPDRVFGLDFADKNGQPNRGYFFLEADRGTMPVMRGNDSQTSFHRKLLAYEATWAQGIHTTRFGFHRFRALTVTQSAARVNSLVDACAHLKSGHGLFLFADHSILANPGILSAPIWRSGRHGEMARILE